MNMRGVVDIVRGKNGLIIMSLYANIICTVCIVYYETMYESCILKYKL